MLLSFLPHSEQIGIDPLLWLELLEDPVFFFLFVKNERPFQKLDLGLLLVHSIVGALACFIATRVASAIIALSKTST